MRCTLQRASQCASLVHRLDSPRFASYHDVILVVLSALVKCRRQRRLADLAVACTVMNMQSMPDTYAHVSADTRVARSPRLVASRRLARASKHVPTIATLHRSIVMTTNRRVHVRSRTDQSMRGRVHASRRGGCLQQGAYDRGECTLDCACERSIRAAESAVDCARARFTCIAGAAHR
jgi:hypothetical protein